MKAMRDDDTIVVHLELPQAIRLVQLLEMALERGDDDWRIMTSAAERLTGKELLQELDTVVQTN